MGIRHYTAVLSTNSCAGNLLKWLNCRCRKPSCVSPIPSREARDAIAGKDPKDRRDNPPEMIPRNYGPLGFGPLQRTRKRQQWFKERVRTNGDETN